MLIKLKEKLTESFGKYGSILYFIISEIIFILPFLYIKCNFFLAILFIFLQSFAPFIDIVFWIWALITVITEPQNVWSIIYYVAFSLYILPEIVFFVITLFNSPNHKRIKKAKAEVGLGKEYTPQFADNMESKEESKLNHIIIGHYSKILAITKESDIVQNPEFEILSAIYVICDFAAISAEKDREFVSLYLLSLSLKSLKFSPVL